MPDSKNVICPGCQRSIAILAEGVTLRAAPEDCPHCGTEIHRDGNPSSKVRIQRPHDPRRSHGTSDTRRSRPI